MNQLAPEVEGSLSDLDNYDSESDDEEEDFPVASQMTQEMTHAFFLNKILMKKKARNIFRSFLVSMHSVESLLFWIAVEKYRKITDKEERQVRLRQIYAKFFSRDSPYEINVSGHTKDAVKKAQDDPKPDSCDEAQKLIFLLMIQSTFDYFLKSPVYLAYKGNLSALLCDSLI